MEKKKNIFVFFLFAAFISFGYSDVYAATISKGISPENVSSLSLLTNISNGTTPASNGTTSTTTPTPKPTTTPTPSTTTTSKPDTTTTPSTTTPSTPSTITPPTSTSTVPPPPITTVPPPKPDRSFDLPSFVGGIILALGVLAIGYVVYKFYRARTDPNYRTL